MTKQINNGDNNVKQRGAPKKPGGVTGKGFRPGQSGNPKGRPSTRGLAARLKVELGQVAKGNLLADQLLTPKQKLFVREYIRDLNATRAAIAAGYSENGAAVQGNRLLRNAKNFVRNC